MSDFSLKSYVTDHKTIHLVGIEQKKKKKKKRK